MALDSQSLSILATVHPELKARIFRVYQDVSTILGLEMRPTRGLASMEDQLKIWMIGRDADGNMVDPSAVVTQAPPGSSWHNYGLAVDSCFRGEDPYLERDPDRLVKWQKFGTIAEGHGLEWGGRFKNFDGPHTQMRFGMSLKDAQTLFKLGGIQSVFAKADKIVKGETI